MLLHILYSEETCSAVLVSFMMFCLVRMKITDSSYHDLIYFTWSYPCYSGGMATFPLIFHFRGFRYDSNSGGEREIQRTILELLNQLDGFDSRGDVKVSPVWVICPEHFLAALGLP